MNIIRLITVLTCGLALLGCSDGQPSNTQKNAPIETESPDTDVKSSEQVNVREYCFRRIGQIQAAPKNGEACDMHATASRSRMEELARPERNSASIHLRAPSLEAIGLKDFTISVNRGEGKTPKFVTGVHTMDQVRIYDDEKDPNDLPDVMAFGSDITGENNLFTFTVADARYMKDHPGAASLDLEGYEIASAALKIDKAQDVPMDATEQKMLRRSGLITGRQYIQGTLEISLIPMGSKGEQYGPTTFAFATEYDWGYFK